MRLDRLGITAVFPCVFCGFFMESLDHVFLHCRFASDWWYWLFGRIQYFIFEVVISYIYKNLDPLCSFFHWDNWVTWNWEALRVIPSHGAVSLDLSSVVKRRLAKWSPPLQLSFKLNFDGAAKGNSGKSRIGAVLFDHNSKLVKVACKYIGFGSNNSAEFHALSFGLDLAISH
ncbi:uncharacterized protein LOC131875317 [Cryptomeria japonica]|uniref:uncharacterized protein LOC131875317 n=1 Tax=Cryptomeria japonica TaxID=3369 RepID=UPI0027DAA8C1|nr:uncharacterized protein LOC131875317 [Cryptomeria japonica]